jgi:gluconokinase
MVVVVGGVAGSGKTTVGKLLAGRLGWRFADADAFHPPANVAKMRAGIPLTDEDRWPWLRAISSWISERITAGDSAVVTCSALKREYREFLLAGRPAVRMVFLTVSPGADEARLEHRPGHFFGAGLRASQFADLELPQDTEPVLVVSADGPADRTVTEIIRRLRLDSPAALDLAP